MASPERMCVGCRGRVPKGELLRVTRLGDGDVVLDATGSAPGRGAYVHRDVGCIGLAMRSRAFDRALRTGLTAESAARLGIGLERTIGAV
jgi:hypothetical protein